MILEVRQGNLLYSCFKDFKNCFLRFVYVGILFVTRGAPIVLWCLLEREILFQYCTVYGKTVCVI